LRFFKKGTDNSLNPWHGEYAHAPALNQGWYKKRTAYTTLVQELPDYTFIRTVMKAAQ